MLVTVTKDNTTRFIMLDQLDAFQFSTDERRQIAFRRVYQRPEHDYTELMENTRIPEFETIDTANAKYLLNLKG